MRPREVASALKGALKSAIEERFKPNSAVFALVRARSLVDASRAIQFDAKPVEFEDDVAELWFPQVGDERVQRANAAFLARIPREHEQLFSHSRDLKDRSIPKALFVDEEWIAERKVLELGCGAGEIAKRLAPRARGWVGIDDSTAALKLARLVSPENSAFVHPSQHVSLAVHHGSIDTVIGREMFVHKNFEAAKELLGFISPFVLTGGRVYAEFFFPSTDATNDRVYPATHPPADPEARFAFSRANIDALMRDRPFTLVKDEERPDLERRFVIFEKTYVDD
jgi:2-polyprenyl-3-methyl-5-hydroxy-6-metoxy-1,4-benzoquinol methylase